MINPLKALITVFLADLRRGPGTALASTLAIAAGVAIFVAIQLAGSAARSSFVSAIEAIAGRATHEVTSQSGIPEARVADFVDLPSVEAAQPVIEGTVAVRSLERDGVELPVTATPLRLLGIDPFLAVPFFGARGRQRVVPIDDFTRFLTEPGTALLPEPWAGSHGVKIGDTIVVAVAGRPVRLRVLAIFRSEFLGEATRDTAVLDISTAQETFEKIGRLDRIDLVIQKGGEQDVRSSLLANERLQRPSERGERAAKMVDAFRLNLLALGSLALLVGSILVFNACHFRVVRRNALLGQLRSLGATRPMLFTAILAEVLIFAFAGGILGLLLGVFLAEGLASSVAQTITDLYSFVRVDVTPLEPDVGAAILVGALMVAAAAGWLPALDAARTSPTMVGVRSREEQVFRRHLPRLIFLSVIGGAIGCVALKTPTRGWWNGLLAAFAFLLAAATLLPAFMALTLPLIQRVSERLGHVTVPIAAGSVYRSLTRAGAAASALGVALAMTLGVIIMVTSFEKEVRLWIATSLRADLYVADVAEKLSRTTARIPDAAVKEIRKLEEVREVDTLRGVEVPYADRSFFFCGVELPVENTHERFEFLEGEPDKALAQALSGDALISEPLSNRYNLHLGDDLIVGGASGPEHFIIRGVFRDFSFDRGYAFTGKDRFISVFGDPGVRNMAVYLKEGERPEVMAERLRRRFAGRYLLRIRSNRHLREEILEVFDRTFALTYLLQLIATILALVGITVTLFGLYLERFREVATLRAVGASIRNVVGLFATESLLMALFPVVLAIPLGLLLAWILIHVVNLQSFGWTITMRWPWGSVLLTCGLSVLAGLSATLVPLALVRRQSLARALREE